jgi:hypothetical protein
MEAHTPGIHDSMNHMSRMYLMNQNNHVNSLNFLNRMNRTNRLNFMNRMNRTNRLNFMNRMNRTNRLNCMKLLNRTNRMNQFLPEPRDSVSDGLVRLDTDGVWRAAMSAALYGSPYPDCISQMSSAYCTGRFFLESCETVSADPDMADAVGVSPDTVPGPQAGPASAVRAFPDGGEDRVGRLSFSWFREARLPDGRVRPGGAGPPGVPAATEEAGPPGR